MIKAGEVLVLQRINDGVGKCDAAGNDRIARRLAAGKTVQKTYAIDQIKLTLWLPKFSGQASRLVGVSLHGTSTLITRDKSGNVASQTTTPYAKTWALAEDMSYTYQLITTDYTLQGLAPAP